MTKIISEIGVNWSGDMVKAKKMIELSKISGVDMVKFQIYKKEHIFGHPQQKELEKMIINKDIAKELIEHGKKIGIEIFFSVFYPEAISWLEELKVNRYKVRAKDYKNQPLIDRVVRTNKPVFLSFPSTLMKDRLLLHTYPKNIKLLYCVSKYPPKIDELHLDTILDAMLIHCYSFDGYSNHYPSILPCLIAASMGMKTIEVHVKIDYDVDCIDKDVSLTFMELKQLCKEVRMIEKML